MTMKDVTPDRRIYAVVDCARPGVVIGLAEARRRTEGRGYMKRTETVAEACAYYESATGEPPPHVAERPPRGGASASRTVGCPPDMALPLDASDGTIKPVRAALLRAGIEALGGPRVVLAWADAAEAEGQLSRRAAAWVRFQIADVAYDY